MTPDERIADIQRVLSAIREVWPVVASELQRKVDKETNRLIQKENAEIRGKIKALQEIQNLPETLYKEVQELERALPENQTEEPGAIGLDSITGETGL